MPKRGWEEGAGAGRAAPGQRDTTETGRSRPPARPAQRRAATSPQKRRRPCPVPAARLGSARLGPAPLALRAARAPTGGGGDSCHRYRGASHAPPASPTHCLAPAHARPPARPAPIATPPGAANARAWQAALTRPLPGFTSAKCACAAPGAAWRNRACAAAPGRGACRQPPSAGGGRKRGSSAPSWRCYLATGFPSNCGDNSVPAPRLQRRRPEGAGGSRSLKWAEGQEGGNARSSQRGGRLPRVQGPSARRAASPRPGPLGRRMPAQRAPESILNLPPLEEKQPVKPPRYVGVTAPLADTATGSGKVTGIKKKNI